MTDLDLAWVGGVVGNPHRVVGLGGGDAKGGEMKRIRRTRVTETWKRCAHCLARLRRGALALPIGWEVSQPGRMYVCDEVCLQYYNHRGGAR